MRRRGTREASKARNRAALLRAARSVFLDGGYAGASVEAVASEAGLTIGAVYSQFGGKAELFLALLEERIDQRLGQIGSVVRDPGEEGVAAVLRQWGGILRDELRWTLLVIEFRVLAARQPELNARFAALHQRLLDGTVEALRRAAHEAGTEPPARLEDLVRAGLAFGTGAALARAAEGDDFSDELAEEVGRAVAARLLTTEAAGRGTT
jgi:AcrR family transcriptional regulator